MAAPYGGNPGAWANLSPSQSPARGYRVISGAVWWYLIFLPWREYMASRGSAPTLAPTPPLLAPLGAAGVFFTDSASLQGLHGPGDFAWRVGLSRQAQDEAHAYGCAVIEFDVPALHTVIHPLPYPGTQQGLTVNGAREWMVPNLNIPLDHTMIVKYIDIGRSGPRCLDIPL